MGCATCGGGAASRASQATRMLGGSGEVITLGLTYADPLLLGDTSGELFRVQVMRTGVHELLRAGQSAWVTGTDVQSLIDDGSLLNLEGRRLAARIWRVGTNNYMDYQQALDAQTATGLPVVEVS